MINYIIQVVLFQALFVGVYDFFLSKETFFTKNRVYLISTALVSFVLPLVKLPSFQKAIPLEYTILLPEVVLSPQQVIEKSAWYQSINYLNVFFMIGCLLFCIVFVFKLARVIRLIVKNERIKKEGYSLIMLPKNSKAFSFFNYIFLGKEISTDKQEKIIQHELVHSKQKHTVDLLLFEFLRVIMWFNPMVYVYQHRISLVHEYISDAVVSKSVEKENYINNLLSDIFQVESISFINQFYKHSLIKKRITMMTKKQSKKIKQLKYLLLIPILGSMILYTSCSGNKLEELEAKKQLQKIYFGGKKKFQEMNKETYLDFLIPFNGEPLGKEISLKELDENEKEEFLKFQERFLEKKKDKDVFYFKLYDFDGRKVIGMHRKGKMVNEKGGARDNVPFSIIDEAPTFPGCPEGDKDCFNKSMQKFINENFDMNLASNLALVAGKKKIYAVFKIDENGNIIGLQVRAPHPKLKQHTMEVIRKLPKMIPGKHENKPVKVGYTLPIVFSIK